MQPRPHGRGCVGCVAQRPTQGLPRAPWRATRSPCGPLRDSGGNDMLTDSQHLLPTQAPARNSTPWACSEAGPRSPEETSLAPESPKTAQRIRVWNQPRKREAQYTYQSATMDPHGCPEMAPEGCVLSMYNMWSCLPVPHAGPGPGHPRALKGPGPSRAPWALQRPLGPRDTGKALSHEFM